MYIIYNYETLGGDDGPGGGEGGGDLEIFIFWIKFYKALITIQGMVVGMRHNIILNMELETN